MSYVEMFVKSLRAEYFAFFHINEICDKLDMELFGVYLGYIGQGRPAPYLLTKSSPFNFQSGPKEKKISRVYIIKVFYIIIISIPKNI